MASRLAGPIKDDVESGLSPEDLRALAGLGCWGNLRLWSKIAAVILFVLLIFFSTGLMSAVVTKRYASFAINVDGQWKIFDHRLSEDEQTALGPQGAVIGLLHDAILRDDQVHFGWASAEMGKGGLGHGYKTPDKLDIRLGVKSSVALECLALASPADIARIDPRREVPPDILTGVFPPPHEQEKLRTTLLDHYAAEFPELVARIRAGETTTDSRIPIWLLLLAGAGLVAIPVVLGKIADMLAEPHRRYLDEREASKRG